MSVEGKAKRLASILSYSTPRSGLVPDVPLHLLDHRHRPSPWSRRGRLDTVLAALDDVLDPGVIYGPRQPAWPPEVLAAWLLLHEPSGEHVPRRVGLRQPLFVEDHSQLIIASEAVDVFHEVSLPAMVEAAWLLAQGWCAVDHHGNLPSLAAPVCALRGVRAAWAHETPHFTVRVVVEPDGTVDEGAVLAAAREVCDLERPSGVVVDVVLGRIVVRFDGEPWWRITDEECPTCEGKGDHPPSPSHVAVDPAVARTRQLRGTAKSGWREVCSSCKGSGRVAPGGIEWGPTLVALEQALLAGSAAAELAMITITGIMLGDTSRLRRALDKGVMPWEWGPADGPRQEPGLLWALWCEVLNGPSFVRSSMKVVGGSDLAILGLEPDTYTIDDINSGVAALRENFLQNVVAEVE
jgi:hypothetical protein